jgi:hypothetical protein
MGQLALSTGPARMGIHCHAQEADIPSKVFIPSDKFMHALNV